MFAFISGSFPLPLSRAPTLPLPLPLQGHSRRVQVTVKPVQHSGTLPLMVEAILSVSIGCVTARSTKLQRGLDSYQVRHQGMKQWLVNSVTVAERQLRILMGTCLGIQQNSLLKVCVPLDFHFIHCPLPRLNNAICLRLTSTTFTEKHT